MTRNAVIRAAGVSLLFAGLWIAWSQAQNSLKLEKVAGNLHVLIGDGGNVAILPTSEGVILVDDKFPRDVDEIRAKVKSLSDKPIRYVLNTHQHGDHTGGNEALLASAEIIAHQNARINMVTNKQPGLPRITFSDRTQVFLGGEEVRASYLGRGHTNGDAVIYFPALKVVHTGDLFINGGSPFIDYSSGASALEWDKTLDRILQLDFDTVIPGHGPVGKKADLIAFRDTFVKIRTRVKGLCPQGADAAKKVQLDDVGWKMSTMFERGLPGMCQELQ